ncbi:MAG: type II toxin-antitoxin system VapC family toxin [Thermoproteales archaeon]|nr:type II toxin-antitoxin system VapC family toxin [Thermoproteales archaeon]
MKDAFVRGEIELIVTQLLYSEVINVLRYKPDYNVSKLKKAADALLNLHMYVEIIDNDILKRSSEIAFDAGVTIYDAIPVAVAEKHKTICLTADKRIQYNKMKDKYPIKLLKHYIL